MKAALSVLLIIGIITASWLVLKGMSGSAEQSALTMHPGNFEKPVVEQVARGISYQSELVNNADQVDQDSGYVTSSGVDIFYRIYGGGESLLIINGGPGMSSEGFVPLARRLAKSRKSVLFDQRGTGRSRIETPTPENISLDLMVQDMEALRIHLDIDQWTIMGHSFGGMLAAYYASKHPHQVNGLIFSSSGGLDMELFNYIDITGRLTAAQQDSLQYWTQRISQGDSSYHAAYQRGLALAPAYVHDKRHVPTIAERLTQGNMSVNSLVFEDMRRLNFDCKPALEGFAVPTLIIQGANDIIDRKTAERTKKVLPQADIIILDHCGHYGWLDREKDYFNSIEAFLNAL